MNRYFACILIVLYPYISSAQNVGIGTNSPGFPLNFANSLGDKIALWGNTGNHYGFGVQSGLLQVHTDLAVSNIAFGHGSSTSFTERVRIINFGDNALSLNGRIMLRNGTSPLDLSYGGGVWMYKADNSALLGFMGVQNNQNMGFFGGPAGWGFTYDAINSRVGIGNHNPNAPLAFPSLTGRKITLFPGATGNVGLGVYNNEFRIHSDYEPADITFGHENLAGVFTERFRFKGNGSFVVNGNAGNAGQVLVSNGPNTSPGWVNNPAAELYNNTEEIVSTGLLTLAEYQEAVVPGLTKILILSKPSKVVTQFIFDVRSPPCAFCGENLVTAKIIINGNPLYVSRLTIYNGAVASLSGTRTFTLPAGTHTLTINALTSSGPTIEVSNNSPSFRGILNIQVIPQN